MQELWRPFNNYEVNTVGKVMNSKTGRILNPFINRHGYVIVDLWNNNKKKHYAVHRLVGMVFPDLVDWTEDAKGRPFEELEINHKDENKENNCVDNLEWCGRVYNNNYGTHNERVANTKRNGKTSKQVYQCTPDGELVRVWPSTAECGRNGFNFGHVASCCRGVMKSYRGFLWSYNPPSQFQ